MLRNPSLSTCGYTPPPYNLYKYLTVINKHIKIFETNKQMSTNIEKTKKAVAVFIRIKAMLETSIG
jgi:hypothetical protein